MSRRLQSTNSTFFSKRERKKSSSDSAVVVFVHLDDTEFESLTLPEGSDETYDKGNVVGYIKAVKRSDSTYDLNALPDIAPYNFDDGIPILGEVVQLVQLAGKQHYKRIPNVDLNTGNAEEDAQLKGYPSEESEGGGSDYGETSSTGTANSDADGDRKTKLGEYFEPTQVNRLKYYEGDKIIESRFGQSIRFSAYNNEENKFSPTIILRNRQNDKSIEDLKELELTEENVIEDGTTIAITSNDYLLNWSPGTEDVPFETEPIYHTPPEELKGTDHVLINSGRIILSSKDSEMIFYSKGDISFISDGKLTIDNGNDGAEIDLNGEYRTTTNDNNMYFLGGSGEIYLNTESDKEPLVRGDTLVKLLKKLCSELQKEIHPTPSGPSGPPTNASAYAQISSELDTILSTLNYTE